MGLSRKISANPHRAGVIVAAVLTMMPAVVSANPTGGTVSAGSATITESGKVLDVNQSSNKAVIDWRSFDIDKGETTNFKQPTSSSITLNRVNSSTQSQIFGTLNANGNVIIVNQNGVLFGGGSKVNVNSLVATTADIDNSKFMNSGKLVFDKPGNPAASITNKGAITAKQAGMVGFVAPSVINNGVITANLGTVHMASGDKVTVDFYGDKLMEVAVGDNVQSQLVENTGTINAAGGKINLTAAAGGKIVNSLINVKGELNSPTISEHNGVITISGDGSNDTAKTGSDQVVVNAEINASGTKPNQKGGAVTIIGDNIDVQGRSVIDTSGSAGGGSIKIGGAAHGRAGIVHSRTTKIEPGAQLANDAIDKGNGGQTVIWSDEKTTFGGNATARGGAKGGNGGYVEISSEGVDNIATYALINTSAPAGKTGILLFDPHNIIIAIGGTDIGGEGAGVDSIIDPNFIVNQLVNNDISLIATNDITINSAINSIGGANTLGLEAGRSVMINADVNLGSNNFSITAACGYCGLNGDSNASQLNTTGGKITANNVFVDMVNNINSGSRVTLGTIDAYTLQVANDGSAPIVLNGDITTHGGGSSFLYTPLFISGDINIADDNYGAIVFGSSVDATTNGIDNLYVNTGSTVTFNNVGSNKSFNSISIDGDNGVTIGDLYSGSTNLFTFGSLNTGNLGSFSRPLTSLAAEGDGGITTGDIYATGRVDFEGYTNGIMSLGQINTTGNLTINTGGFVQTGDLGSIVHPSSININATNGFLLGNITTTGDVNADGGAGATVGNINAGGSVSVSSEDTYAAGPYVTELFTGSIDATGTINLNAGNAGIQTGDIGNITAPNSINLNSGYNIVTGNIIAAGNVDISTNYSDSSNIASNTFGTIDTSGHVNISTAFGSINVADIGDNTLPTYVRLSGDGGVYGQDVHSAGNISVVAQAAYLVTGDAGVTLHDLYTPSSISVDAQNTTTSVGNIGGDTIIPTTVSISSDFGTNTGNILASDSVNVSSYFGNVSTGNILTNGDISLQANGDNSYFNIGLQTGTLDTAGTINIGGLYGVTIGDIGDNILSNSVTIQGSAGITAGNITTNGTINVSTDNAYNVGNLKASDNITVSSDYTDHTNGSNLPSNSIGSINTNSTVTVTSGDGFIEVSDIGNILTPASVSVTNNNAISVVSIDAAGNVSIGTNGYWNYYVYPSVSIGSIITPGEVGINAGNGTLNIGGIGNSTTKTSAISLEGDFGISAGDLYSTGGVGASTYYGGSLSVGNIYAGSNGINLSSHDTMFYSNGGTVAAGNLNTSGAITLNGDDGVSFGLVGNITKSSSITVDSLMGISGSNVQTNGNASFVIDENYNSTAISLGNIDTPGSVNVNAYNGTATIGDIGDSVVADSVFLNGDFGLTANNIHAHHGANLGSYFTGLSAGNINAGDGAINLNAGVSQIFPGYASINVGSLDTTGAVSINAYDGVTASYIGAALHPSTVSINDTDAINIGSIQSTGNIGIGTTASPSYPNMGNINVGSIDAHGAVDLESVGILSVGNVGDTWVPTAVTLIGNYGVNANNIKTTGAASAYAGSSNGTIIAGDIYANGSITLQANPDPGTEIVTGNLDTSGGINIYEVSGAHTGNIGDLLHPNNVYIGSDFGTVTGDILAAGNIDIWSYYGSVDTGNLKTPGSITFVSNYGSQSTGHIDTGNIDTTTALNISAGDYLSTGDIGSISSPSAVTLSAANGMATGSISTPGAINLTTSAFDINTGNLHAGGEASITGVDNIYTGNINAGGPVNFSTVNNSAYHGNPIGIFTSDIDTASTISIDSAGILRVNNIGNALTPSLVTLEGDDNLTVGNIHSSGAVNLTAQNTFAQVVAGDLTAAGTININSNYAITAGKISTPDDLIITNNDYIILGDIGGVTAPGFVSISGSELQLNNIRSTGVINLAGYDIYANNINTAGAVTADANGYLSVGNIGATAAPHSLEMIGSNGIYLNGNITTADGGSAFSGPVVVQTDSTIKDTGSGSIVFHNTVDGNNGLENLVVNTGGSVSLGGAIGTNTRLNSVRINSHNALQLPSINAGSILARTTGIGADLTIDNGSILTASNDITLVAAHDFINNEGSDALQAGDKWLVYATDTNNVNGGLAEDFHRYSCTYGSLCPTLGNGSGFLYSYMPVLTVTADAKEITYGDNSPNYTYGIFGYVGSDADSDTITGSAFSSSYVKGSSAGRYDITHASGALLSSLGYGFNYTDLASGLVVDKADLTITADSKTRYYGDGNPTLTATYTGLVNNDHSSAISGLVLSASANAGSDVNDYAIIASGATSTNYNITFRDGVLSVTPATLTITANNIARLYGTGNPTLAGTITGFKNGQDSSILSLQPTYATIASAASPTGYYAITASGAAGPNYIFHYIDGELRVQTLPSTVTALDNLPATVVHFFQPTQFSPNLIGQATPVNGSYLPEDWIENLSDEKTDTILGNDPLTTSMETKQDDNKKSIMGALLYLDQRLLHRTI